MLAQELHADALLMDDWEGVKCARAAGLNVVRTAGVYLLAKDDGLILSVAPKLDALRRVGFRLKDAHYDLILKRAGEL